MNPIALMTSAATESAGILSIVVSMLPLVLVIVVMYFILIRPRRKREGSRQDAQQPPGRGRDRHRGGIVGRVVSLREDTILIETGSNNTQDPHQALGRLLLRDHPRRRIRGLSKNKFFNRKHRDCMHSLRSHTCPDQGIFSAVHAPEKM